MAKVIASGIADVFDPDYDGEDFSHEFTITEDSDGAIWLNICHSAVGIDSVTSVESVTHADDILESDFDNVIYSVDN